MTWEKSLACFSPILCNSDIDKPPIGLYIKFQPGGGSPCEPRQVRKEAAATVVAGCPAFIIPLILSASSPCHLPFSEAPLETPFSQFQDILDAENFFADRTSIAAFCASPGSKDCKLPLAVLRPRHSGHVSDILAVCRKNGLHLRIRGAGTRQKHIQAAKNELVLLTTGMDRILEIEPENQICQIQCGVRASALNTILADYGLYYPHQLFPASPATLGGEFAANTPDIHSIRFGAPAQLVQELEVLLSTGETLTLARQNSQSLLPSFPVAQLMCGSQGLLGLIAKIKLRLLPLPEKASFHLLKFSTVADAILATSSLLKQGLVCDAMEILDSGYSEICLNQPAPCLYIALSFPGCGDLDAYLNKIPAFISHSSLTPEENGEFLSRHALCLMKLKSRADASLAIRAFIPQNKLCQYIQTLQEICANLGIKYAFSVHAGLAFINALLFDASLEQLRLADKQLFTLELMYNGRMASEAEADLDRTIWKKNCQKDLRVARDMAKLLDPDQIFSHPLFETA